MCVTLPVTRQQVKASARDQTPKGARVSSPVQSMPSRGGPMRAAASSGPSPRLRSANSVASVRMAYLEPTPTEAIAAQSNVIGAVPATYMELPALSIVSWMSSH